MPGRWHHPRRVPSGGVFVSDFRHFLDLPVDAPGPARRMADHLSLIVRAATAGDGGVAWMSALPCRCRPGRRACPGLLRLFRSDVPASIEWRCPACGDEGVISGWERTSYDLRAAGPIGDEAERVRTVVSAEVAATLRGLALVDSAGERLIFRATPSADGIVLVGTEDDLEELTEFVAAEANHEHDRRRQKRLDTAFDELNDALDRARTP